MKPIWWKTNLAWSYVSDDQWKLFLNKTNFNVLQKTKKKNHASFKKGIFKDEVSEEFKAGTPKWNFSLQQSMLATNNSSI